MGESIKALSIVEGVIIALDRLSEEREQPEMRACVAALERAAQVLEGCDVSETAIFRE